MGTAHADRRGGKSAGRFHSPTVGDRAERRATREYPGGVVRAACAQRALLVTLRLTLRIVGTAGESSIIAARRERIVATKEVRQRTCVRGQLRGQWRERHAQSSIDLRSSCFTDWKTVAFASNTRRASSRSTSSLVRLTFDVVT